jgi:hypothetical protein
VTKRDLFWLLGFPVFLILGTIRHEGAHALIAWMQGAEVTEFTFLPGFWEGQFYFGYVLLEGGKPTWLTTAAPYLFDLLTFAIFFMVCAFMRFKKHWVWLLLVIVGVISPLANSGYQYFKPGLGMRGDIGELLAELQPGWVHGYMIVTILLYGAGVWFVLTRSKHVQEQQNLSQQTS